ncbi:MAG TPA: glycosyltransferase family 1 protein [Candidatus Eremiobacteraceae bacterium]|nr:glycosyltransferase family 1 protein [Candidatus Eremiobacteraceae bacterium]
MPPPNVVLDARLTRQMSVGMRTYVRELAARLPRVAPDIGFIAITNVDLRASNLEVIPISTSTASNFSFGEQLALPMLMRGRGSICHYMSIYAPRISTLPYIYTIHDLIHRRFPEYHSWKIPPFYRFVAKPVANGARAVITDACATLPDLQTYLHVASERVRVVPLGVGESFVVDEARRATRSLAARERFGLHAPYVLYAGNHRKHKNLETLFDAWSRLDRPCDLVLTEDGPFDFSTDRYVSRNGRIVPVGHVDEELLVSLYAGCAAAVQPSSYEGFGLSVLEGMAAGSPVVVAQTPALLEVAGDAALTFPLHDAAALTAQLERTLAGGPAIDELRARGRKRAAEYTWDRTARMTADVYREAMHL